MIVTRREVKYSISEVDYCQYVKLFDQVLKVDPHSKEGSYTIRSLYFDTPNNDDYYSKMNGEEVRKKIRLRIYGADHEQVKLELKRKLNVNQIKETVLISKEDAISLTHKKYEVLLKYPSNTAQTIYNMMTIGQYEPVVLIDYERRAYYHEENDIRITFDSQIRSSETNFDLFCKEIPMTPVLTSFYMILEVKFNGELFSWLSDLIKGRETINHSISKYCISRQLFDQYLA